MYRDYSKLEKKHSSVYENWYDEFMYRATSPMVWINKSFVDILLYIQRMVAISANTFKVIKTYWRP